MKRSTIIILLLLVLIAAGVLYYLWRKSEPPAPGAAPSLVSLLPADASYVFYADAAALRSSAFVQKLLAALPSPKEDREYADFVRRTGFDYTRDLDRLAVAVSPSVEASKSQSFGTRDNAVLAVVEGRFDRAKIAAYAMSAAAGKRADRGGHEAYLIPSSAAADGGNILLAFLSQDRLLLTDRTDGGPAGYLPVPPEASGPSPLVTGHSSLLEERIARVAASEFFAVARVGPPEASGPKNLLPEGWVSKEIQEALASVRWVTLSLRPVGGSSGRKRPEPSGGSAAGELLSVVLEAESESPGDARQLAWGLEGLRVLARMALSDPKSVKGMDPLLAALLETILKDGKITSADRYVRLSFSLGPDFLAALKPSPPAPRKSR